MKKNVIVVSLLLIIVIFLSIRCIDYQYANDNLNNAAIEIAPFPEGTLEEYVIYFANSSREHLVKEIRIIERMNESKEEIIMRELIKGPTGSTLRSTIPPRVRLYSITTVEGITYVNFSKEFLTNFSGEELAEVTTIYSIVNSLTELNHVNKVAISVEGEKLEIYNRHMSLKEAYERNEKINRGAFPTPIDVVKKYFNNIADKEYRRAYDLLYRPLDKDIDYSMFFHQMREVKGDVVEIIIRKYSVFWEPGTITIIMDYDEVNKLVDESEDPSDNSPEDDIGDEAQKNYETFTTQYKDAKFILKNEFGEWKIVIDKLGVILKS